MTTVSISPSFTFSRRPARVSAGRWLAWGSDMRLQLTDEPAVMQRSFLCWPHPVQYESDVPCRLKYKGRGSVSTRSQRGRPRFRALAASKRALEQDLR